MNEQPKQCVMVGMPVLYFMSTMANRDRPRAAVVVGPGATARTVNVTVFPDQKRDGTSQPQTAFNVPVFDCFPNHWREPQFVIPAQSVLTAGEVTFDAGFVEIQQARVHTPAAEPPPATQPPAAAGNTPPAPQTPPATPDAADAGDNPPEPTGDNAVNAQMMQVMQHPAWSRSVLDNIDDPQQSQIIDGEIRIYSKPKGRRTHIVTIGCTPDGADQGYWAQALNDDYTMTLIACRVTQRQQMSALLQRVAKVLEAARGKGGKQKIANATAAVIADLLPIE